MYDLERLGRRGMWSLLLFTPGRDHGPRSSLATCSTAAPRAREESLFISFFMMVMGSMLYGWDRAARRIFRGPVHRGGSRRARSPGYWSMLCAESLRFLSSVEVVSRGGQTVGVMDSATSE